MMVDLRKDSEQVRETWSRNEDRHVPLVLAAALAFHEARPGPETFIAQADYDDALNLTAAALSCVVDIYAIHPRTGQPVPLPISLRAGRFADGGAAYKRPNGRTMTSLVVRCEHLAAAVNLVKAAGLPFDFLSTEAQLR